jgi:hypothetical protein
MKEIKKKQNKYESHAEYYGIKLHESLGYGYIRLTWMPCLELGYQPIVDFLDIKADRIDFLSLDQLLDLSLITAPTLLLGALPKQEQFGIKKIGEISNIQDLDVYAFKDNVSGEYWDTIEWANIDGWALLRPAESQMRNWDYRYQQLKHLPTWNHSVYDSIVTMLSIFHLRLNGRNVDSLLANNKVLMSSVFMGVNSVLYKDLPSDVNRCEPIELS